ncbi:MAG: hypothetical protein MJ069_02165 [Salinivirgaceae bacterium]|nr:hypothetical protein [Salinivirgaceae bacterium]
MEQLQLLGGFKQKFEQFVELYQSLKSENKSLKEENIRLKNALSAKESELEQTKKQQELNQMAGIFTAANGGNKLEAKNKIARLVREIDNCIALLNR